MSTHGNVVINTLERAVSDDFNNAESIMNRLTVELGLALVHQKAFQTTGNQPTPDIRSHVASGLVLELNAGALELSPGMLLQSVSASPPDVPTPGTYDSNFRLGLLMALEVQADPWDASNAWWLLQSRVELDTTLTETRDIYTPATATFAPSGAPIDKVQESVVVSSWKKGTATTLPAPDAGYAPIAGVFRPVGGGAITEDDILQLSVQLDDLTRGKSSQGSERSNFRFYTAVQGKRQSGPSVLFDLEGTLDGKKLFAKSRSIVPIRDSQFVDPTYSGSLATPDLWWYVYLVPLDDEMPSRMYGQDIHHKGVIVITRVPPNTLGTNSAVINLPDPVGGSVSAGGALHVAVFQAAGVAADIHYINIASNGEGYIDRCDIASVGRQITLANSFASGAHDLATIGVAGTESVPIGLHMICEFSTDDYDTGPSVAYSLEMAMNMPLDVMSSDERPLLSARSHFSGLEFEIYPELGATTLTITPIAMTAARGASGGGLADMGGNEYNMWAKGIRF